MKPSLRNQDDCNVSRTPHDSLGLAVMPEGL